MLSFPNSKFAQPSAPVDRCVQRGNAGYLAPGQTAFKINFDKLLLTGGPYDIPLCTVPAGKTFLFTDMYLSHDGTSALRFSLAAGPSVAQAVTVYSAPVKGDTAPIQGQGQETQVDVPAGMTLYLHLPAAAGVNAYGNLAAIQQAAGIG